jgi:uncharacterized MnhB-related membrane protein
MRRALGVSRISAIFASCAVLFCGDSVHANIRAAVPDLLTSLRKHRLNAPEVALGIADVSGDVRASAAALRKCRATFRKCFAGVSSAVRVITRRHRCHVVLVLDPARVDETVKEVSVDRRK